MGDLSTHFSRREFACKGRKCCGHSAPVDATLVLGLQALRDMVGAPLRISSGFRCNRHNKAIGGAKKSYHTVGMAADVMAPVGWRPEELALVAAEIPAFGQGGIGVYDTYVHLDVRSDGPARW